MTTINITLPCKPHANQLPFLRSTTRFNVMAAGRRFGKTEIAKIRSIYKAVQGKVWWIAPTYETGQHVWRDFERTFQRVPGVYINRSERLIQFDKRRFLQVKTADSVLRGAGLDHVAIDEAAFCRPDLWQYVIRPMLLDNPNSTADFLSSTNGRNWFWQVYQQGEDPEQTDWQSWHYTSYDNPRIDPADIDDIKRNTPERVFEQEYLAAFLDDGGAVFRNLKACIYGEATKRTHNPVVAGVDWGRSNDYSVITIIDTVTMQVVEIDRFTGIEWDLQRARMASLIQRYRVSAIFAEENSFGSPNIRELERQGYPIRRFTTTNASKSEIINSLALAFEQQSISIPDDPVLLGELQAYTLERLPSGNFRYNAPPGMHDDTVISLALAWHGVARPMTAQHIEIPDLYGHFT